MLFAINERIFDTEDIYSISNITNNYDRGYIINEFTIEFFGLDHYFKVMNTPGIQYYNDKANLSKEHLPHEKWQTISFEEVIKLPQNEEKIKELSELRDKIINLWNNDKSKIIQFTI